MSRAESTFQSVFGYAPAVTGRAPGRVNLLGEHTDYQGGFVLPAAIPQQATVSIGKNGGHAHRLHSANLHQTLTVEVGEVGTGFAPYLTGSVALCGVHEALDIWVLSSLGKLTSVTMASLPAASSQYFCRTCEPSLPGLPDGMRISISCRSPNSDRALPAPSKLAQS